MSSIACGLCGVAVERDIAAYSADGALVCDACHANSGLDDRQITSGRQKLYLATFLLTVSLIFGFDPFRILTIAAFFLALNAHRLSRMLTTGSKGAVVAAKRTKIWATILLVISGGLLLLNALMIGRLLMHM